MPQNQKNSQICKSIRKNPRSRAAENPDEKKTDSLIGWRGIPKHPPIPYEPNKKKIKQKSALLSIDRFDVIAYS